MTAQCALWQFISVIQFIHSWIDDMFKHQFRLTWEDFCSLEHCIYSKMAKKRLQFKRTLGLGHQKQWFTYYFGVDALCHTENLLWCQLPWYGFVSSWYQVDIKPVPDIYWWAICNIDKAINNVNSNCSIRNHASFSWKLGCKAKRSSWLHN